jgi:hypothetical protein
MRFMAIHSCEPCGTLMRGHAPACTVFTFRPDFWPNMVVIASIKLSFQAGYNKNGAYILPGTAADHSYCLQLHHKTGLDVRVT